MNLARASLVLVLILLAGGADAQPPTAPGQPPVADSTISDRREATNDQKDWHFIGSVELKRDKNTTIYADEAWYYAHRSRVIAKEDHGVLSGLDPTSAARVEFQTSPP